METFLLNQALPLSREAPPSLNANVNVGFSVSFSVCLSQFGPPLSREVSSSGVTRLKSRHVISGS